VTQTEPAKTCHKVQKLVDVKVVIEPNLWLHGSIHDQAKQMEAWAKEFKEFIRDHRSQDVNSVDVERVYETQCSACGKEWEEMEIDDTGTIGCAWCGVPMQRVT